MGSHRLVNVHDTSRGLGGRRVRGVHSPKLQWPVAVVLAFALMCVIIGGGSTCRSLR